MGARSTFAIPLPGGKMFPQGLPKGGIQSEANLSALRGVEKIAKTNIAPGPSPSVYAFVRSLHRSNLYRVPLD